MNVFFAIWIGRLRGYPLWVMVHEFAIMDSREISLVRRIQAWITRRIARSVMKAADRIFYATPQWKDAIVRAAPSVPSRHLPVPSNVLMEKNTALIERMRTRLCGERYRHVVGHFGSYRMPELFEFLRSFTRKIIEKDADCIVLFLGRGSDEFVADSISLEPSLKDRTFATGAVDPATLSNYLCSCDVLVQPYRHGVATNRSSVMAGLALGIPIVTTKGINTESIWSGCVSLVPFEIEATVKESIDLLRDEGRRQMLSTHSLDLYKTNFDVRCSIEIIQNPDEPRSI